MFMHYLEIKIELDCFGKINTVEKVILLIAVETSTEIFMISIFIIVTRDHRNPREYITKVLRSENI